MFNHNNKILFKKIVKDPLFHFLVLGGLLFIFVHISGKSTYSKNTIVVTQAKQKHIKNLFKVTWQRPPSSKELKNLIDDYIKEEIYYREALALGLDDDDTIVRRRMRQKLEFLQEDLSSLILPTDTQLKTYFLNNQHLYVSEDILSFRQVVVSSKKLNEHSEQTQRSIDSLKRGVLPETVSRSSLLPVSMNLESATAIKGIFGMSFLKQLKRQEMGKWSGPVYSAFGTHLVNISLYNDPVPLTFEEAHDKVVRDFSQSQKRTVADNHYSSLRNQYHILVEGFD